MLTEQGRIYRDSLVSYGSAPGYPEIFLTFLVDDGVEKKRVELHISGKDAEDIRRHIVETQQFVFDDLR